MGREQIDMLHLHEAEQHNVSRCHGGAVRRSLSRLLWAYLEKPYPCHLSSDGYRHYRDGFVDTVVDNARESLEEEIGNSAPR
jgi:hypothetical protein